MKRFTIFWCNFTISLLLPLLAQADEIVSFRSADYTSVVSEMQGRTAGDGDIPYTEAESRNPARDNYHASLPGAVFYGGYATDGNVNIVSYRVGNHGVSWKTDFIQIAGSNEGATAGSTVTMLTMWLQPDFLNGHNKGKVTIKNDGTFQVAFRSGMSGAETEARLVVKKAGKYFISNPVGKAQGTVPQIITVRSDALAWFTYNPQKLAEVGVKAPLALEEITGVGVWAQGSTTADRVGQRAEIGEFLVNTGS